LWGIQSPGVKVTESAERMTIETEPPSEAILEALMDLIPGAVADGVIDAARIGEAAGLPVAGLKDSAERFGLMWAGKSKAVEALQAPSMAALAPDLEESINWDSAENVFIEGDNLEVLKLLQKAYNDQVKLIYIDPPYNTGNDFVYNDDFSQPLKHYLEVTGQVDAEGNRLVANTEVSGRKHSNWLNMMYPRLVLARNMLTQDGMIFVSIDDNESANLKQVLDELFGVENFIAQMIWNSRGGGQDTKDLVLQHEYVLVYSRDRSFVNVGGRTVDAGEFPLTDSISGRKYKRQLARKWGSNSRRVDRPNLFYGVTAPDGTQAFPMRGISNEGRWRWSRERFETELTQGNVEFQHSEDFGWVAYQRIWEPDGGIKTIPFGTIFPNDLVGNTGSGTADARKIFSKDLFSYPKSVSLMKTILDIGSVNDRDLVVDFFAGSGTMGQAVVERNFENGIHAKYLLVTIDEPTAEDSIAREAGFNNIAKITQLRLAKVLEGNVTLMNQGLRICKLAKSSFRIFDSLEKNDHELLFSSTLSPAAINDSIAAEVFLKSGVRLDMPWQRLTVATSPVIISDGVAVVLSRALNDDIVSGLLGQKQCHTVVFLEDAFAGLDDVKANAYFAFKQASKTMKTI